jgi:hypothetical protein
MESLVLPRSSGFNAAATASRPELRIEPFLPVGRQL